MVQKRHREPPNTSTRCALMIAAPSQAWNVFKQSFVEHWEEFKRIYPRDDKRYCDELVDKMLGGGNPDKRGDMAYRCLPCGEGTHRGSMSCQSSLCLRCAKVYVDNWVSQVSRMLHEGVIYRPIVLTVPAMLRQTFYQQAKDILSPFMRCGVRCLDDVFSRVRGKPLKGGYLMVLQTPGRHGQYNPHRHRHCHQWRLGSGGQAVGPSRLYTVSLCSVCTATHLHMSEQTGTSHYASGCCGCTRRAVTSGAWSNVVLTPTTSRYEWRPVKVTRLRLGCSPHALPSPQRMAPSACDSSKNRLILYRCPRHHDV